MKEVDFLGTSGEAEGEELGEIVESDVELRAKRGGRMLAEVPRGILRVATVLWRRGFSVGFSDSSKFPEVRKSNKLELLTRRLCWMNVSDMDGMDPRNLHSPRNQG